MGCVFLSERCERIAEGSMFSGGLQSTVLILSVFLSSAFSGPFAEWDHCGLFYQFGIRLAYEIDRCWLTGVGVFEE